MKTFLKADDKYEQLAMTSLAGDKITPEMLEWVLNDEEVELLPLLHAAYRVRFHHFGNLVRMHILNNVQSGNCSEDCRYCAQSKDSTQQENIYPMKSDEEILEEARLAYEAGAYRYCMVFSGRDLGKNRIARICDVAEKVHREYDIELCVSAGFLTEEDARALKMAGVSRYNHNINTSQGHYGTICTTHSFEKRVATIHMAKQAGLDICSGVIIGLGERCSDIVAIIDELANIGVSSVPLNFFIPTEGHRVPNPAPLTPHYCLRVLCAFRFALPHAEIRIAAGRELHLRSMQALSLYPANSLFAKGYLTVGGESVPEVKKMIVDAGFELDDRPC
jgi:biotin synthase